jgi:hypothetical protein
MLTKANRILMAIAAVVLVVGTAQLLAQEPMTAQGQLVRVDTSAKTVTIRSSDGGQMQFQYTADTKVTGGDQSVAGLATVTGSPVTVQYVKQDKANIATQIAVSEKK